jgi:holliday junction DNA helicase RuvA
MIGWLKGELLHIEDDEIIVNSQGVGYLVLVGTNLLAKKNPRIGDEMELVIYTSVKEDEIRLIGFESFLARKVFTILLTVNGVGPKAAVKITDALTPEDIVFAVNNGNHTPFLQVSGIGKKTAQKIVIDLQSKVDKLYLQYSMNTASGSDDFNTNNAADSTSNLILKDAKSALKNLGFYEAEIKSVIGKHAKLDISFDELIRKCLSELKKV